MHLQDWNIIINDISFLTVAHPADLNNKLEEANNNIVATRVSSHFRRSTWQSHLARVQEP